MTTTVDDEGSEFKALSDALAALQGEHPADVYTEAGYRVWLSSTVVKICARKTAALLNARCAFDELHDGVPGLDDPTTLGRIREWLESTAGTGYRRA